MKVVAKNNSPTTLNTTPAAARRATVCERVGTEAVAGAIARSTSCRNVAESAGRAAGSLAKACSSGASSRGSVPAFWLGGAKTPSGSSPVSNS